LVELNELEPLLSVESVELDDCGEELWELSFVEDRLLLELELLGLVLDGCVENDP